MREWIVVREGDAAIVFRRDGGDEATIPRLPDDAPIDTDTPTGRAGLCMILFADHPQTRNLLDRVWREVMEIQ